MDVAKKKALHFSSKDPCRTDSTKRLDGPRNYRFLKIKSDPFSMTINGWKLDSPQYDLGEKYHFSPNEFLAQDFQSQYFEQHFRKHEQKIQQDYKKKLIALRDYLDDINNKCNFTKLSREELFAKLKRENKQYRSPPQWKTLNQTYFPTLNNNRYSINVHQPINMTTTFMNDKSQEDFVEHRNDQSSSLEQFSFPQDQHIDFLTPLQPTICPIEHEKTVNTEPAAIEYADPTLESVGTRGSLESENDDEHKKFRSAYEEFEDQTNVLYKMTNQASDRVTADAIRARAIQKKRRTSNLRLKTDVDVRRKSIIHKELADEFNKINYFFMNEGGGNLHINSPARKHKAMEEMKQRKKQQLMQKTLINSIISSQTQKSWVEPKQLNTINIENLKAKQENIIKIHQKRTMMFPSRSQFTSTRIFGDSMSQSSYTCTEGSPQGSITLHNKDGSLNDTPCSRFSRKSKDTNQREANFSSHVSAGMKHNQRRLKVLIEKQKEPISIKLSNHSLIKERPKINIITAESFTY